MHPVPPVMDFIGSLKETPGAGAVPFVTYGAVNSGVALHDLGQALTEKGFHLWGAAKIPAPHSMMWRYDRPLGEGRPSEEDIERIRQLVEAVLEKIAQPGNAAPFNLEDLNYQSPKIQAAAKESGINALKQMLPPLALSEDDCTECGTCQDHCPTSNISLDPYPRFLDRCILCFNCVRVCPTEAITNDVFKMIEVQLRKRAETFGEGAETGIFL